MWAAMRRESDSLGRRCVAVGAGVLAEEAVGGDFGEGAIGVDAEVSEDGNGGAVQADERCGDPGGAGRFHGQRF